MKIFFHLTLILLGSYMHDIQVASFIIQQEAESLVIDFVLERDDLMTTIREPYPLTDNSLQAYILSHFQLEINAVTQNLSFEPMQHKDKHISLRARTNAITSDIQTIEIENTCLTNIKGHSNIVELRLHDQHRDFLMNNKRTSIEVSY